VRPDERPHDTPGPAGKNTVANGIKLIRAWEEGFPFVRGTVIRETLDKKYRDGG
jgi:hypothetical protein